MELETTVYETQISLPWKWRPFKRHMRPGCEFFADGDEMLRSARKLVPVEIGTDEEETSTKKELFPCGVVGCVQMFNSLLSYENHYNSVHRHACSTCHRTFPSPFLLDIHLQEQHDSLFTVLATRQSMYRCLVEQCDKKFPTPTERRDHLIKVHKYPANFRFHRDSQSGNRKKTQPKHRENGMEIDPTTESSREESGCSKATDSPLDLHQHSDSASDKENVVAIETAEVQSGVDNTGVEAGNMEVDSSGNQKPELCLLHRVSVHRVPDNVSFGHGIGRGFHRPAGKKKNKGGHWHQRLAGDEGKTTTDIAHVDMTDMASALEDV